MSDYQHDYNQRQYRLMLSNLTWFENGRRSLHALVSELQTLLNVLEGTISESWLQSFDEQLVKLDSARAHAIVDNVKVPDQKMDQIRLEVLPKLRELVLEQVDESDNESDS